MATKDGDVLDPSQERDVISQVGDKTINRTVLYAPSLNHTQWSTGHKLCRIMISFSSGTQIRLFRLVGVLIVSVILIDT